MAIIYVDIDSIEGGNDGSSWSNAYTDLQSALRDAGNGDRIWVAEGTYTPTKEDNRRISFVIRSGVELYGGFTGGETEISQRDYENNETTLSVNIGEETAGDNSLHVIDITNTSPSTLIDGITISDGNANGRDDVVNIIGDDNAGGIFGYSNANATVKNSIIVNNFASNTGGGIATGESSNIKIINTVFFDNEATNQGGAIYFFRNRNPIIYNF